MRLPARTTLRVAAGAVILGSRDPAQYPLREQHWEGRPVKGPDALIWAADAEDVAITGEGVIDGQGEGWREALRAGRVKHRPRLISFQSCSRVKIEGVHLTRSPAWTVHPWRCRGVRIKTRRGRGGGATALEAGRPCDRLMFSGKTKETGHEI